MIHELCRCRRCNTVPRHLDTIDHTETGLAIVESYCVACGMVYVWRVRSSPDERAILCDERRIPRQRLARLRAMEGSKDARH